MESCRMTVACTPGLPALARIVAVLHGRNADISLMRYDATASGGRLVIEVSDPDVACLAARIRRLVDVSEVRMSPVAAVAVAS
jgi:acetolactate synthase regulatory subunit